MYELEGSRGQGGGGICTGVLLRESCSCVSCLPKPVPGAALGFSTLCPKLLFPGTPSLAQTTMTMGSQIIARKLHSLLEPAIHARSRAPLLPGTRLYATQGGLGGASGPTRKQITVVSDDGRVRWGDLSTREKAARTTQQSVNFVVVIAGVVMTVRFPP